MMVVVSAGTCTPGNGLEVRGNSQLNRVKFRWELYVDMLSSFKDCNLCFHETTKTCLHDAPRPMKGRIVFLTTVKLDCGQFETS